MARFCFKCLNEIKTSGTPSRRDSCDSCGSDLRVCRNCKFHDKSAYNECNEPQAERVLEKDRSNYCDYFTFAEQTQKPSPGNDKKSYMNDLDDLFKK